MQVAASPPLLAAAAGGAVGLPALAWWRGRFGGYAGQLAPDQARQVLQEEDALLIDIRCRRWPSVLTMHACGVHSAVT
jgi:hypothetical protein